MDGYIALTLFGSFFVLVFIGVPISFSIGIATVASMLLMFPWDIAAITVAQRLANGLDNFALLAIPFFIFAGTLMNSGYSRKLEYEADAAAVAILKQAGYEPGALVAMLENMAENWDSSRLDFAATHPPPAERIAQLKKAKVKSSLASNDARQQRFLAATKSLR